MRKESRIRDEGEKQKRGESTGLGGPLEQLAHVQAETGMKSDARGIGVPLLLPKALTFI